MIKKWIVIPLLILLTMYGALYTIDTWFPFIQKRMPKADIVIDKGTRKEAIVTLAAKLNAHYVFPDKARQIEAGLLERLRDGKYDAITDGDQFADRLTLDLHAMHPDLHMLVRSSTKKVPYDSADVPEPTTKAKWDRRTPFIRRALLQLGIGLGKVAATKVDHLDHNIGYLALNDFAPPFVMGERYAAAMDKLADTDGLIVDLRDNRGGGTETVDLLSSYFFDRRTRVNDLWDRTSGVTTQRWTSDHVDGKRYGGTKPVVILVGPNTKSAGEDFAYTMQVLKRATVIGKPTWGGAHPGRPYRLSDHFYAWIPSRRTISPITQSNWEAVGVMPDVAAEHDDALEVGKALLQRRLQAAATQLATAH